MLALVLSVTAALAADFPYDQELLLDAAPMRGSKRVPSLEVGAKGEASIDLWCNTVPAQLVVAGDTITILTGTMTKKQCEAERMQADDALLAALQDVTGWRMGATVLTLSGSRELRFRLSTH